jgi:Skp family chaperone for outer membrane proteins
MRKMLFSLAFCLTLLLANNNNANAQTFKVGVFDIELMIQAMPGYRIVDSLIRIYEADTLGAEFEYNQNEYKRLDSVWRVDSALVAQGKKSKPMFDILTEERRKMMLNIVYWQQIAQNKINTKRNQLAQPLITAVSTAYQRVLARKKYSLILKPETYELGFPIDNLFVSVARELKLDQLPQELLYLGDDPDAKAAPKQPATQQKPPAKPQTK